MKKNLPRKGKGIAFNVSMLYIMNIAKLVFPLITLPYLTRVLSVDCYGVVSYVKATMVYAQLVVDFGFMLSGVKAITEAREDRELVGRITGNVILAKVMLSIASLAVIVTAALFIPILRENMLYTILAFIPIALSTLLLEFLFRGLELMHIIAARYVLMKSISVGLTLVLVKGDSDILAAHPDQFCGIDKRQLEFLKSFQHLFRFGSGNHRIWSIKYDFSRHFYG